MARQATTVGEDDRRAAIVPLALAIAETVRDGDSVALEGFTHLIPYAAGHEILRQGRRDLTLIRMTPDLLFDQLIGMGCARRLVFSWGGNPGVGSLHRFRDAVENGWPVSLELEEHSHAGMANRYAAGAAGLPFAVLRGYAGSDLAPQTDTIRPITCPFTGEVLDALSARSNPDVAVIHAQQADHEGNVQLWGITGIQKEAVLSARRVDRHRRGGRRRARAATRRGRAAVLDDRLRLACSGRRAPVLRARLHRARQRVLRRAGMRSAATGTPSARWIEEHVLAV